MMWNGTMNSSEMGRPGSLFPSATWWDLQRPCANCWMILVSGSRLGKSARNVALLHHDFAATSAVKRRCYLEILTTAPSRERG